MNDAIDLVVVFATSAAVGLLVGLERERNPHTKAGLRTFALIAVFGTLCGVLAQASTSGLVIAAGALAIGGLVAGAHLVDPATVVDDSGTTTTVAALTVFGLGAANAYGHTMVIVAVGIAMTALLHFKVELEGVANRLTPTDLRSILQFGAITAVILPLLPNEPLGPYGALNPFHIWLMVVLIAGVSLSGYVAWRLTWVRRGLLMTGLLGGLASSTATTLAYARQARAGTQPLAASLVVILLANTTMFGRVLLLTLIVAPEIFTRAALVLLPALVLAAPAIALRWRAAAAAQAHAPPDAQAYSNPTQLGAALLFAAGYAVILIVSAWAAERVGAGGLYGLAFVSGLTDVDAITLSVLQLFNTQAVSATVAATALALAVASNLLLKATLAWVAGGSAVGRGTALGFAAPVVGLALGLAALRYVF
ncbi:MAG: MgtC/SapB family protein [Burkholderiaceae bacterium]|nr:MgtC/SapB family protein [Burkholderiaceae bacterium]